MLAFTTECSVVTTDCMNALQRVLEHINYHVVTIKPPSPFLLKCYFITVVCVHVTCVGLHCMLQNAHVDRRVTCGSLCPLSVYSMGSGDPTCAFRLGSKEQVPFPSEPSCWPSVSNYNCPPSL